MRALEDKKWLLRSRSSSHVQYEGRSLRVDRLAQQLTFTQAREVNYKGRKAEQHLAEAQVSITRASQSKRTINGKKTTIKGCAVECRLVVSKVLDKQGKVLAWWYLLSNIGEVDRGTLALWYYWRWSIESFFKLLKTAGMHMETWQQESGDAIARRLLVACMACVFVWQIAETKGPEASELRDVLIRLSGRQMKYGVAFTRPALFAGLCALLTTLDLLEHHDLDELKRLLRKTIGGSHGFASRFRGRLQSRGCSDPFAETVLRRNSRVPIVVDCVLLLSSFPPPPRWTEESPS